MRMPTPTGKLYAWWRDALAGLEPAIHDGMPECGWFRTRLVKGGPWVPAVIWCQRTVDPATGELVSPETLLCEVDGMRRDPAPIWTYLRPISRADYNALMARREELPEMKATMAKIDLTKKAMLP